MKLPTPTSKDSRGVMTRTSARSFSTYIQPELTKRDQVCAVLAGYPNAQVPACLGSKPNCATIDGHLGCCDNDGNCTYYTSCNGGFAPSPCTNAGCLQCPQSTPYCAHYQLYDAWSNVYDTYACGVAEVDNMVIYGSVTAQLIAATGTIGNATAASTTTLASSASTTGPSSITATTTSDSSGSASATSSSPSFTGSASPSINVKKNNINTAAIAGGVVGGVAGLILIVVAMCLLMKRRKRRGEGKFPPTLQQGRAMSRVSSY